MHIELEQEIIQHYPGVQIGYLIAEVSVAETDPFVESLKTSLSSYVQGMGLNATNFAIHPTVAIWREIYERDFQVKAKTYRSSLEALLRRVVTGKEIWKINSIVDLYNCHSVLSLLPMGAYDLDKVSGDISIRYAREGETFLALGEKERIEAKPNHIVYADEKRLICWLWNHKDSRETCLDENSKRVIFFIDAFDRAHLEAALERLAEDLKKVGGFPLSSGVLNQNQPRVALCS